MEIKALSASRMDTWLTCRYKYGCKYHNFHPEVHIEQPVYFKLGTAVHAALEYAGKLVKDNKLKHFSDKDRLDIITQYYIKVAKEGLNDNDVIADGESMLRAKLSNFEFDMPILSLESKFEAEIDGVPVIGAMDRVVELGSDDICVIDYKTSRTAKTEAELLNDVQVGVYDIIASQIYPDKNITVCLDFLRHAPQPVIIPPAKRESNILLVKSVYKAICDASEEDLKPNVHQFCPWCDYASVCPALKAAKDKLENFDVSLVDDIGLLSQAYMEAAAVAKSMSLLKDKLGAKIEKALASQGKGYIKAEADGVSYKVSVRQNAYTRYNIHDVYNMLGADRLVNCADVNKSKFEREAAKAGLSKDDIASIQEVNFSKPFISVRTVKN